MANKIFVFLAFAALAYGATAMFPTTGKLEPTLSAISEVSSSKENEAESPIEIQVREASTQIEPDTGSTQKEAANKEQVQQENKVHHANNAKPAKVTKKTVGKKVDGGCLGGCLKNMLPKERNFKKEQLVKRMKEQDQDRAYQRSLTVVESDSD